MNEILHNRIEEAAANHKAYAEEFRLKSDTSFICGVDWYRNHQWISVEEALPPYDKAVIGMDYMPELTWDDQTIIFVHRSNNPEVVTDKNKFCVYPPSFCKVTHWMPIPSLEGDEK